LPKKEHWPKKKRRFAKNEVSTLQHEVLSAALLPRRDELARGSLVFNPPFLRHCCLDLAKAADFSGSIEAVYSGRGFYVFDCSDDFLSRQQEKNFTILIAQPVGCNEVFLKWILRF